MPSLSLFSKGCFVFQILTEKLSQLLTHTPLCLVFPIFQILSISVFATMGFWGFGVLGFWGEGGVKVG